MIQATTARLRLALRMVGEYLQDRSELFEVVAVGGAALMLLELVERTTEDVDLLAIIEDGTYRKPDGLPPLLEEVRDAVATRLGLAPDWLNTGPSFRLDHGLPPGFEDRTEVLDFGGLVVHLASRIDQIHLKVLVAAERGGPGEIDSEDLRALDPSPDELVRAARWTMERHNPSEGHRTCLVGLLRHLGVEDANERLEPGL